MKCPCNHCKYQATQTELHVEKISNKKQLEGTFESYSQRTLYWPYPTKANLIAGPGRDYNIPNFMWIWIWIWVSFWLVGLWSISHVSSVLAVVIPLWRSHFSCYHGQAAPDTLNDLSLWIYHQRPLKSTLKDPQRVLSETLREYSRRASKSGFYDM